MYLKYEIHKSILINMRLNKYIQRFSGFSLNFVSTYIQKKYIHTSSDFPHLSNLTSLKGYLRFQIGTLVQCQEQHG
ncbi:hypothetical protein X975_21923, partial [Stegodyphus mimosarum]